MDRTKQGIKEIPKIMRLEEAPVLFIFFNRYEKTHRCLDEILRSRPHHLVLASDGARPHIPNENKIVKELRESVIQKCSRVPKVTALFSESNLGCAKKVSASITETLSQWGRCVIIEDDCVPHPDFIPFANEMLNRYEDDERIHAVTGTFLPKKWKCDQSYGFSSFPMIWGWATWSRAWSGYDLRSKEIAESDLQYLLEDSITDSKGLAEWVKMLRFVHNNPEFTWDYQFILKTIKQRALCVHPYVNLISNIGYDSEATHTTGYIGKYAQLETHPMGALRHQPSVAVDRSYNKYLQDEYFHDRMTVNSLRFKIRYKAHQLLRSFRRRR